ncbi:pentatricopeptide repeat-containing protein At3g21470-like, partial [Carica papaya]|uniref:pentatricopeptide repeat-containing protein At3g21470-like n=1 Tax=Carica papaya TaxID=3649 RepID=UPI000B8CE5F8
MKPKYQLCQAVYSLHSQRQASHEAYTRLVLECVRVNDVDLARRLQSHMETTLFEPNDTFLHNRLLHLYARSGKLSFARNLFDKMPNRDIFSWNMMLSAYAKSGSVENLRTVFEKMPVRDSVSYNTVISGFSGNGFSSDALAIFVRMQKEGFEPSAYTHVSALQACSQLLDLKRGKQIHGRLLVSDSGENAFVWNAMIDLYAKCGEVDRAKCLFDRIVNKTVVSWNSMISGYLKNGQPDKCIDLFHEMQLLGLKPDQVTFSNVLGAYIQSGHLDDASKIFSMMKGKDKICWTTMIVGFAQKGKE